MTTLSLAATAAREWKAATTQPLPWEYLMEAVATGDEAAALRVIQRRIERMIDPTKCYIDSERQLVGYPVVADGEAVHVAGCYLFQCRRKNEFRWRAASEVTVYLGDKTPVIKPAVVKEPQ